MHQAIARKGIRSRVSPVALHSIVKKIVTDREIKVLFGMTSRKGSASPIEQGQV